MGDTVPHTPKGNSLRRKKFMSVLMTDAGLLAPPMFLLTGVGGAHRCAVAEEYLNREAAGAWALKVNVKSVQPMGSCSDMWEWAGGQLSTRIGLWVVSFWLRGL